MIKRILFVLVGLGVFPLLWAQSPDYLQSHVISTNMPESTFSGLDMTKVPSGFLLDKSLALADITCFNGQTLTDSNYVCSSLHSMLMNTIRGADVSSRTWNAQYGASANDSVPILIALYRYNRIKSTALSDGSLQMTDGILYDCYTASGMWMNPYDDDVFYAITPAIHIIEDSFTVTFSPELTQYQNVPISRIELNAGDGTGFHDFPTGGLTVTYSTLGVKELIVRVTTPVGVYSSHSVIEIKSAPILVPSPRSLSATHERVVISKQLPGGGTISAELAIHYADSINRFIRKPFIYAEGFDPKDLLMIKYQGYNGYNDIDDVFLWLHGPFEDYDIIYINWNNSEVDIRDNAELLIEIINWVNHEKHENGSPAKNILVGESMGGLIARYALRQMEINGTPHECDTYVSNDSPHKGAHVPLGYLYALNGLLRFLQEIGVPNFGNLSLVNPYLAQVNKYLHAVSVQQMLYNYVDANCIIDHSLFQQFQNELSSLGLPHGDSGSPIDNIALINGGALQLSDALLSDNCYLKYDVTGVSSIGAVEALEWLIAPLMGRLPSEALRPFIMPALHESMCIVDFHLRIKPDTGGGGELCSFSFLHHRFIRWFPLPIITSYSFGYDAPGSLSRLDFCEGSKYVLGGDSGWVTGLSAAAVAGYAYFDVADRFMFIPSVSALNLPDLPSESFSAYTDSFTTPFDAYCLNSDNSAVYHTALSSQRVELIEKMAKAGKIEGPSICDSLSVHYSLSGEEPDSALWSTSDTTRAIIDAEGWLTAKQNGPVRIRLSYDVEGAHFEKKRDVLIAAFPTSPPEPVPDPTPLPPVTLQVGLDSLGTFVEVVPDEGYHLADAQAYCCTWYVKVDDQQMDFIYRYDENMYRLYLENRPELAQDKILVSVRIAAPMGTSPLYSIIIPYYKEFSLTQPQLVQIAPNRAIYFFDGSSLQPLSSNTPLILQSTNEEIRPYLRNNARLVIMENGHEYPNISQDNDKLVFPLFVDSLFATVFGKMQQMPPNMWPYPLHVQIRALVYEDELIKDYVIPIIRVFN